MNCLERFLEGSAPLKKEEFFKKVLECLQNVTHKQKYFTAENNIHKSYQMVLNFELLK